MRFWPISLLVVTDFLVLGELTPVGDVMEQANGSVDNLERNSSGGTFSVCEISMVGEDLFHLKVSTCMQWTTRNREYPRIYMLVMVILTRVSVNLTGEKEFLLAWNSSCAIF
ncbi:hypothetical protein J3458_001563 [Metarhizium acridum]|uniref:uncharacterized protein n=1 Tax=Metarhizium acridum TaxID=92637 RepID=UPI001C6D0ADC|nr:hypothetical protein J3458_001563 [Metarhizium acridum]